MASDQWASDWVKNPTRLGQLTIYRRELQLNLEAMRTAKEIAAIAFWFGLWTATPAVLLYPVALWMLNRTNTSQNGVVRLYVLGIGLLFLPSGFLVGFIYRHFCRSMKSAGRTENSNGAPAA